MTQRDFFAKTQTDNLLRLRFATTCAHPQQEGDKPDFNNDAGASWYIDKNLLYAELAKRSHRVRAKDRRKKIMHPAIIFILSVTISWDWLKRDAMPVFWAYLWAGGG